MNNSRDPEKFHIITAHLRRTAGLRRRRKRKFLGSKSSLMTPIWGNKLHRFWDIPLSLCKEYNDLSLDLWEKEEQQCSHFNSKRVKALFGRGFERINSFDLTYLNLSSSGSYALNGGWGGSLDDRNLCVWHSQIVGHKVRDFQISFPRNEVWGPPRILVLGQKSPVNLEEEIRGFIYSFGPKKEIK